MFVRRSIAQYTNPTDDRESQKMKGRSPVWSVNGLVGGNDWYTRECKCPSAVFSYAKTLFALSSQREPLSHNWRLFVPVWMSCSPLKSFMTHGRPSQARNYSANFTQFCARKFDKRQPKIIKSTRSFSFQKLLLAVSCQYLVFIPST